MAMLNRTHLPGLRSNVAGQWARPPAYAGTLRRPEGSRANIQPLVLLGTLDDQTTYLLTLSQGSFGKLPSGLCSENEEQEHAAPPELVAQANEASVGAISHNLLVPSNCQNNVVVQFTKSAMTLTNAFNDTQRCLFETIEPKELKVHVPAEHPKENVKHADFPTNVFPKHANDTTFSFCHGQFERVKIIDGIIQGELSTARFGKFRMDDETTCTELFTVALRLYNPEYEVKFKSIQMVKVPGYKSFPTKYYQLRCNEAGQNQKVFASTMAVYEEMAEKLTTFGLTKDANGLESVVRDMGNDNDPLHTLSRRLTKNFLLFCGDATQTLLEAQEDADDPARQSVATDLLQAIFDAHCKHVQTLNVLEWSDYLQKLVLHWGTRTIPNTVNDVSSEVELDFNQLPNRRKFMFIFDKDDDEQSKIALAHLARVIGEHEKILESENARDENVNQVINNTADKSVFYDEFAVSTLYGEVVSRAVADYGAQSYDKDRAIATIKTVVENDEKLNFLTDDFLNEPMCENSPMSHYGAMLALISKQLAEKADQVAKQKQEEAQAKFRAEMEQAKEAVKKSRLSAERRAVMESDTYVTVGDVHTRHEKRKADEAAAACAIIKTRGKRAKTATENSK